MSDNESSTTDQPDLQPSPDSMTLADTPEDQEGRIGYGSYGRFTPIGIAALIIAVVIGIGIYQHRDSSGDELKSSELIGSVAPDVSLPLFDGSTLNLSDLRGQVVVLNFWAQWCDPCKQESPLLRDFSEKPGIDGVNVAVIGVDIKSDDVERAKAFVERYGLTYPIGQDSGGSDPLHGDIEIAFGTPFGYPTTIFISPTGVITANHLGPLNEQLLNQYVKDAAVQ